MSKNNLIKKPIFQLVDVYNNIRVPLSSNQRKDLEKIYPYYGAQGIVDYVDNYLFDGEHILVAEDGENLRSNNQNICNLVSGKFWVNNHAHILKANNENVTKYLFYNFNRINFINYVTGSAQPKLNKENLLNIKTFVHSKQEQEKISSILSNLDSKIELNNKINSELEKMAKTLYDYWFVQFDFQDENGKPYKSSGGKMAWSDELKREIPEGWEVETIKDLLDVVTGKEDANFATKDGKYNFFTCGEDILKCDEYKFDGKAVLVAGNGNFNVKLYEGKFNAYQRTYVLIPDDEKYYTLIFIAVSNLINHFKNGSNGSIVKFIRKGDIENIMLPLPKQGFDDLFNQLNSITKKIEVNLEENQKLEELRDWLLPMLMNGQVSVK